MEKNDQQELGTMPEASEEGGGMGLTVPEASPKGLEVTSTDPLLQMAIAEKVPVEFLERLVALQERVAARTARAEFYAALAQFQRDVGEIRRRRTAKITTRSGGEYSYTYAPLEDIVRVVREPLAANGLSYTWDVLSLEGGNLVVQCTLRHVAGHEEKSQFPVPTATTSAMSEAQKIGSALTYGKRQSLTSVLGLATAEEDADGQDAEEYRTINEEEFSDLLALMQEVGADQNRFLAYMGVEALEDITINRLPFAIQSLEDKRRRAAERGEEAEG